jgi:hypothetical protein
MRRIIPVLAALVAIATGCDPNSQRAFTSGRSQNLCTQTIPACAEVSASCEIDSTQYIKQRFPGDIAFLVQSRADDEIEVELFMQEVVDVGQETVIYWNEPGCSDYYQWDSKGEDFVSESRATNTFSQTKQMAEPGEHLIEINSDLNGVLLIGIDVLQPGQSQL